MKCGVCNYEKKGSLIVNGVRCCSECVRFFVNLAKCNSRSTMAEIDHQTKYIINRSPKEKEGKRGLITCNTERKQNGNKERL